MKIALRHPSGIDISFEGDENEFGRFLEFVATDLARIAPAPHDGVPSEDRETANQQSGPLSGEDQEGDDLGEPVHHRGEIDPRLLADTMERVKAKTDIDRVTVIAQAAVDAGLDGVTAKVAEEMYDQIGVPKPARMGRALFNAKERGFLRSAKHGTWRPTVNGENFARYGKKPSRGGRRLSASSKPTNQPDAS